MESSNNPKSSVRSAGSPSSGQSKDGDSGKQQVEPSDSLKYAIFLMDKKIRNLEKKKVKVEKYAVDRKDGKELNEDQLKALSRLDETLYTLSATRDMKRQFDETLEDLTKQTDETERSERTNAIIDAFRLDTILQYLGKGESHREGTIDHLLSAHFENDGVLRESPDTRQSLIEELTTASLLHYRNRFHWLIDEEHNLSSDWLLSVLKGTPDPIPGKALTYDVIKSSLIGARSYLKNIFLSDPFSEEKINQHQTQLSTDEISKPEETTQQEDISGEPVPIYEDNKGDFRVTTEDAQSSDSDLYPKPSPVKTDECLEPETAQQDPNPNPCCSSPPPVKSLTFTNRNYTMRQMNPDPMFNFDALMLESLGIYDLDAIGDHGTLQSPVTFLSDSKVFENQTARPSEIYDRSEVSSGGMPLGSQSHGQPQRHPQMHNHQDHNRHPQSSGIHQSRRQRTPDDLNVYYIHGFNDQQFPAGIPHSLPHHQQRLHHQNPTTLPFPNHPGAALAAAQAAAVAALYPPDHNGMLNPLQSEQTHMISDVLPGSSVAGHMNIPGLGVIHQSQPYQLSSPMMMNSTLCQNNPFDLRAAVPRGIIGNRGNRSSFHRQPIRQCDEQQVAAARRLHFMQDQHRTSNQTSGRNFYQEPRP